jgi:hypothetical protein
MTKSKAKQLLQVSLRDLRERDLPTFGTSIGERPIVFRIAYYMQCALRAPGLTVDCDYNRDIDGPNPSDSSLPVS